MTKQKGEPPRPLTVEALITGMIACRGNARELLSDANLLAENSRDARAYALLHTACEELGKFAILELGARGLLRESPPNWRRFWRRFRSHDSKAAQLEVQLMLLTTSSDEAEEINQSAEAMFSRGLHVRNSSLYADVGPDGSFRKPSDIGFDVPLPELRAVVVRALDAAQERGASPVEIEEYLRAQPNRGTLFKLLARVLKRARDAGVEKEHMLDMTSKQFK